MAVGETSGQGGPRRLITAGGGRRRIDQGEPGSVVPGEEFDDLDDLEVIEVLDEVVAEPEPTLTELTTAEPEDAEEEPEIAPPVSELIAPPPEPDALERRLAADEAEERRNRDHHSEAPHFRRESD
jgi:hypothetical protein